MGFFRQIRTIIGKSEGEPTGIAGSQAATSGTTSERRAGKRRSSHKGRRVLIIDDSLTIVAALRKMLRSAGCETIEAMDAERGLELLRKGNCELVFLDIVLPGMNGFAALRLMRRDPLTQHIPVILISGNEQATEQFYARRIGADDFMKKPFSRVEVFARIDALIEANKLRCIEAIKVTDKHETAAPEIAPAPATPPETEGFADTVPNATPPLETTPKRTINPLEARKQLTAMGLQYFNQEQLLAAAQRWDQLALEFFIAGGGVDTNVSINGKSLIELAQERQSANLVALLQTEAERGGITA